MLYLYWTQQVNIFQLQLIADDVVQCKAFSAQANQTWLNTYCILYYSIFSTLSLVIRTFFIVIDIDIDIDIFKSHCTFGPLQAMGKYCREFCFLKENCHFHFLHQFKLFSSSWTKLQIIYILKCLRY